MRPESRGDADPPREARQSAGPGLVTQAALGRVTGLKLAVPPTYSSAQVVSIRTEIARVSQSVFARILNVSLSTVQKWEAPAAGKHPSGAAATLLRLVERNGVAALVEWRPLERKRNPAPDRGRKPPRALRSEMTRDPEIGR